MVFTFVDVDLKRNIFCPEIMSLVLLQQLHFIFLTDLLEACVMVGKEPKLAVLTVSQCQTVRITSETLPKLVPPECAGNISVALVPDSMVHCVRWQSLTVIWQ